MNDKDNKRQLEVIRYLQKGNQFVFYIFNRTNKISYALYVITDLIKDEEPLKWTLRSLANQTVSLRNFLEERSALGALEKLLMELESYLELARFSKVVSEMNADLLLAQVTNLAGEIRERSAQSFYSPTLASNFFDTPPFQESFVPPQSAPSQHSAMDKSHKGHSVFYDFYASPAAQQTGKSLSARAPQSNGGDSDAKGQRQEQILKIIKEKQVVTIKDITERISDCSEKTVQRILTALVQDGVLKKTGERRWSRYSMK